MRLAPEDPRAAEQLASIVADAEDADRLEPLAASLAARFPDRPDPRYYQATVLFLRGRAEEAIAAIRGVVDRHPDHARAQNLLGAACATLGRRECAQSAFEASLRADPQDPSTYINLGALSSSGRQSTGGRAVLRRGFVDRPSVRSRAVRSRTGSFRSRKSTMMKISSKI